jgi:hypothetical protein
MSTAPCRPLLDELPPPRAARASAAAACAEAISPPPATIHDRVDHGTPTRFDPGHLRVDFWHGMLFFHEITHEFVDLGLERADRSGVMRLRWARVRVPPPPPPNETMRSSPHSTADSTVGRLLRSPHLPRPPHHLHPPSFFRRVSPLMDPSPIRLYPHVLAAVSSPCSARDQNRHDVDPMADDQMSSSRLVWSTIPRHLLPQHLSVVSWIHYKVFPLLQQIP